MPTNRPSALESPARVQRRKPESLAKLKRAARKLFVERGYHATRPQDIARQADLGHGTFYLHFPDKRACFLGFVDDARRELDGYVRDRIRGETSLDNLIAGTLDAIYDYSETHPGVLAAALGDEGVIAAEGSQETPLLMRWGDDWAETLRQAARDGRAAGDYDFAIIGQAVVGLIHQASMEGYRSKRNRKRVTENLAKFLVRALKP